MKRSVLTAVSVSILLAGCGEAAFDTGLSDGEVARVGDEALTEADLESRLEITDDRSLADLDPAAVRADVSTWVEEHTVGAQLTDEMHNGGIESIGYVCVSMIPAPDEGTADLWLSNLTGGTAWADVLAEAEAATPGVSQQADQGCIPGTVLDSPQTEQFREPLTALTAETPYQRISPTDAELIARFNPADEVPIAERISAMEQVGPDVLAEQFGRDAVNAASTPAGDCVSHLLVADRAAADAAGARLAEGEAFAAVAGDVSTDTGSAMQGGALGCFDDIAAVGFVPEFSEAILAATPGEPTEPVESQFGFHIILVNEPASATEEQLASATVDVRALLAAGDQAEVTIDPSYGRYDAEAGVVALG